MSAKKTNISQIKKYLAGQLDTRAMHELEREAMNDPFLMDALEGYERNNKDQQENLEDLANRLQQRMQRKKRLSLWPAIGVAASVLLFIGVGAWLLLQRDNVQTQPAITRQKPVQPNPVSPKTHLTDTATMLARIKPPKHNQVKPRQQAISAAPEPGVATIADRPTLAADAAADRSLSYGYFNSADSIKQNATLNEVAILPKAKAAKLFKADTLQQLALNNALLGRVAGVDVLPSSGAPGAAQQIRVRGIGSIDSTKPPLYIIDGVPTEAALSKLKPEEIKSVDVLKDAKSTSIYGSRAANGVIIITTNKTAEVKGQVLAKTDNQPLPYVTVKLAGENTSVLTDANGHFTIRAKEGDVLDIAGIGFEKQEVKVQGDKTLEIRLHESSKALAEVAVAAYGTQRRTDLTGSVSTIIPVPGDRQLQGKVPVKLKRGRATLDTLTIRGQVVAKSDHTPLSGVTIKIAGKDGAAVTDLNGRFAIAAKKDDLLEMSYVGFEKQQVKVKSDKLLEIKLDESKRALSEVVVVGYGTTKNSEVIEEAHPARGWEAFNQYLNEGATSATGKTGVVKVTFLVNADNTLSGFKIIKSLSPEADQKAIDLIKNGPQWQHNVNGEAEKVQLRIRFKK